MKLTNKKALGALALMAGLFATGLVAYGSSHREAPMISGDSKVDATDLYAFVSPDNKNTVTLIANYIPFQEPAGGPNFYTFDDNAKYAINIDNNGDAKADIVYEFKFKTTVGNPNTFLYNTGAVEGVNSANLNVKQTYTVTKIENGKETIVGSDLAVAPVNVGPKSTPNYTALQAQAIYSVAGSKVFVGQSDDPFFVELGGLFDLLTIRKLPGNAGGGVDGLKGYNVSSIALQVPISDITKNKNQPTDIKDGDSVVGVWTTSYRKATRVLAGASATHSGDWVQVSRLGAPLVNEVVVPLGAKDLWNSSIPENDAQFANGVTNPELGGLLKALYNIAVPPQGAFGSKEQRDDLIAIFLTGIPGLTQPKNVVPSEELRLNVAVPVSEKPNALGVLGGDSQGYPNGRRLADDVTDISIKAVAGAAYSLFHPDFKVDATGAQLGDGVDANDKPFRSTFPYLAVPFSGYDSMPHGNTTSTGSMMSKDGAMMSGSCVFTRDLSVGSVGEDVTCLQTILSKNGYFKLAPIDTFGKVTKAALMEWQASAGLPATGYFGPLSREALK